MPSAPPGPNLARGMRCLALLAVALLAVAGAPAARAAGWSAPFTVTADHRAVGPSAAADPRGGMVVVWQHDTGRAQPPSDGGYGGVESYIRARAFAPNGSAGTTQTLSITDDLTTDLSVAVDGKGGALAVWTQAYDGHRFTIIACPRVPAGRFGARQALGRTNRFLGGSPKLGMNARGDAVVMWARSDLVELAARRSGGHFGPPQDIAARRPVPGAVVVGADGAALATWTARGGVYASQRAPGHRFGTPRLLNPGGPGAGGTTAAIGPDGTVAVAWLAGDSAFAAVGERGRAVGAAQRLASFYRFGGLGAPAAVVTRAGETLVAWPQGVRNPAGDRTEVALASRLPGGSFGVLRVLSAPGVSASAPALAAERSGEVTAAWSEAGPIGPAATWWISTAVRPDATSDFTPGQRLPRTDGTYRPSALLGADASTLLVWDVANGPLLGARRSG
jgi:hypothetical protein